MRRLIAVCTLGNMAYEEGDILWANIEFIHSFMSEEEVRSELEEGGLCVIRIQTALTSIRGGAICKKSLETG